MTPLLADSVNMYRNQSGEEILQIRLADESITDAYAVVEKLKKGSKFDVEIRRHYKKRSLDANAYAWALMDKLAVYHAIPKTHMYRELLRDVGGVSYTYPIEANRVTEYKADWESKGLGWMAETMGPSKHKGYMNVHCIKGSSQFNTQQMAKFLDLIIQECIQAEIPVEAPEKVEQMVKEWRHEE